MRDTRSAAELVKLGYRRVSNKSRMVARIDREDWQKVILDRANPAILWNLAGAADHYRRVYSEDTLEMESIEEFKKVPNSNWDPVGFILPDGTEAAPYIVQLVKDNVPYRGKLEEALQSILEWTHARSGNPEDDDKALRMIRTTAAAALGVEEKDSQAEDTAQ